MKCPFCCEEIKDGAVKCKHCKSDISHSVSSLSSLKSIEPEKNIKPDAEKKSNVAKCTLVVAAIIFLAALIGGGKDKNPNSEPEKPQIDKLNILGLDTNTTLGFAKQDVANNYDGTYSLQYGRLDVKGNCVEEESVNNVAIIDRTDIGCAIMSSPNTKNRLVFWDSNMRGKDSSNMWKILTIEYRTQGATKEINEEELEKKYGQPQAKNELTAQLFGFSTSEEEFCWGDCSGTEETADFLIVSGTGVKYAPGKRLVATFISDQEFKLTLIKDDELLQRIRDRAKKPDL